MVGLGDGAGQLPVSGRLATFAYSKARACCACSRGGTSGLYFYRRDRASLNYSISIFEEKCSKVNAMREKKECAIVLSVEVE